MRRGRIGIALASALLAAACGDTAPPAPPAPLAPSPLDAHVRKFTELYLRKDYAAALREATAAVEAAPERRETFELLSRTFAAAGWDAEGVAFFQSLVPRYPTRSEPWFFRGSHEANLARFADAAASFAEAATLAPDDAEIRFRLGQALQQAGQPERAVAELRRAHDLDPASVGKAATLMAALSSTGRGGDAEQVAVEMLGRLPESAEAHFSVAQLRMRQSRWDDAEALLRKALELDPSYAPARADLDRLTALRAPQQGARK